MQLYIGEFDTWALAFHWLNQLENDDSSMNVLEFGQISAGKIIAMVEGVKLPVASDSGEITVINESIIEVKEAYFKTNNVVKCRSFAVCEGLSLGNVCSASQGIIKDGQWIIIEIFRAVNGYPRAWSLLGSERDNQSLGLGQFSGVTVTHIEKASPFFIKFMNESI